MANDSEVQNSPDVVFVGAGPVGLWTAIQAKLRDPNLEIVFHEKYEEYKRSHVLRLNKKSFKGIPDTKDGRKFKKIVDAFPKFVKTNVIEQEFKNFAEKLGVQIIYERVDSCEELAEQYPDTPIFIGADGSHSLVRQQVFDDEKQIERNLQYIAEIKYFVEGKTKKLNPILEGIPVMSYSDFTVSEHVGKERDGKTPVTVRFFLDEETFEELRGEDGQGGKFNKPFHYEDLYNGNVPESLAKSMREWIKWRKKLKGDELIRFNDDEKYGEKITAINLAVYASEEFVKEVNGQQWVLVGDAAMGVPYFRALNAGLLCGTELAKALRKHFNPEQTRTNIKSISSDKNDMAPLDVYAREVQRRVDSEISTAKFKDKAVNTGRFIVNASVRDVHVSRGKLLLQTSNEDQFSRENIVDLLTWYLLENYHGGNDFNKYISITEHFTEGDGLERMREFPSILRQAYNAAIENFDYYNAKKLNYVTNILKSSVYNDALKKQTDIRKGRKKTAKILSLWGLLLPCISHLVIWGWYYFRKWNEPLRSHELSPDLFQEIYATEDEKEDGDSPSRILDRLNQDKQPVRYKEGEYKAHRAVIGIINDDEISSSETESSAEETALLSNDLEKELTTVQVISTRWNRQARHFDQTVREARQSLAY